MSLLPRRLASLIRPYRSGDEARIEPPDSATTERVLGWLGSLERRHEYQVDGFEHVPTTGPALLVSAHSFAALDMFLLGKRIYERDGRLVRGLTDHLVFRIPGLRDVFSTLGVIQGTQDNGQRLLESGQLAACMPGGGLEWSRSSRQKRTLRWGSHRGYARLAVRAGVPIVPTACPAADDLYFVLNDGWQAGQLLQRVLKTARVLPLTFAVGLGPVPFPVKLTQYVAQAQWPKTGGSEEKRVRELDGRVREIVRDLLRRA